MSRMPVPGPGEPPLPKTLTQVDAVLSDKTLKSILDYLSIGGSPITAVQALSASYEGQPQQLALLDQWAGMLGVDLEDIRAQEVAAFSEVLAQHFDPRRADQTVARWPEDRVPRWVRLLIADKDWRTMVYRLSERHPKCKWTTAVIRACADQYREEVSQVPAASGFVSIFTDVLLHQINEIGSLDEDGLMERLGPFTKTVCRAPPAYFFAQMVLHILSQRKGLESLLRLSREMEKYVREYNSMTNMVSGIRNVHHPAPPEITSVMQTMIQGQKLTPGDIVSLHRLYTGPNPPSVEFLMDQELLDTLLDAVYLSANPMRQDLREKYLWLLMYVATHDATQDDEEKEETETEEKPVNGEKEDAKAQSLHSLQERVLSALQQLDRNLPRKPSTGSIQKVVPLILEHIRVPIASMAIQSWIKHVLHETAFYETYFRSLEVPIPHLLLDEIAFLHPLQRPQVFSILSQCYDHPHKGMPPQLIMALRRMILDSFTHLIQLGFTDAPMLHVRRGIGKVDESLTIHFIRRTLSSISPPYTPKFYASLLHLISGVSMNILSRDDGKELLYTFFDDSPETMDPESIALHRRLSANR